MKGLERSQDFPIIILSELSVVMETRVLIRSSPKRNAAFPPPNDASVKLACDRPIDCGDIHV